MAAGVPTRAWTPPPCGPEGWGWPKRGRGARQGCVGEGRWPRWRPASPEDAGLGRAVEAGPAEHHGRGRGGGRPRPSSARRRGEPAPDPEGGDFNGGQVGPPARATARLVARWDREDRTWTLIGRALGLAGPARVPPVPGWTSRSVTPPPARWRWGAASSSGPPGRGWWSWHPAPRPRPRGPVRPRAGRIAVPVRP